MRNLYFWAARHPILLTAFGIALAWLAASILDRNPEPDAHHKLQACLEFADDRSAVDACHHADESGEFFRLNNSAKFWRFP